MFNIGDLISRAWKILWNYRVLWIFALLLALSGGAGGGGGGSGGGGGGGGSSSANLPADGSQWFGGNWERFLDQTEMPQWLDESVTWFEDTFTPMFATEERAIRSAVIIVGIIIGISILISLLLAWVRYPSETAVMRLVDEYEHSGIRLKFKEGWRRGWDVRAWRLFLVDLLIGTPAFTIVILLVGLLGLLIYNLVETSGVSLPPAAVIGIIVVSLIFVAFILLMALVGLLRQYVARYVTLEGAGVGEAFRRGWGLFKSKFWGTVVLGLVQAGLGIAFGFAAILVFFLLIPAYAILAIPGALVAALPGGLAYLLANLSLPVGVAVAIGALVALPFFFIIIFSPLSFFSGMFAVFTSNIWTLAFRSLQPIVAPPLPVVEIPPGIPNQPPVE
jgi:hypothetical protein